MDNSTKTIIIVGALVICILLIGASMFVFNDSSDKVTGSLDKMSTQEVEAHNTRFAVYEGTQQGSNIKSLLGMLITNSNTNKTNVEKIPGVFFEYEGESIDSDIPETGDNLSYKKQLESIRKQIDSNHEYWIETTFQDNGYLDYIVISYDEDNPVDLVNR